MSHAAIAVTAGFKSSVVERGVDLIDHLCRRELANTKKWLKSNGGDGSPVNKLTMPAAAVVALVVVTSTRR